jgi:hypothetical protein
LLIAAGFHKWDIAAKMTTQHDTRHGNMTRTIRWHEIARAALVLGIIEDYSKGSIFKLRALLVRQLEAGRTVQTSSPPSRRVRAHAHPVAPGAQQAGEPEGGAAGHAPM